MAARVEPLCARPGEAKFGDIFLATASDARFVDVEVAELLFVGHMSLQLNHVVADFFRVLVEGFFKLEMALRVEREFDRADATAAAVRKLMAGVGALCF